MKFEKLKHGTVYFDTVRNDYFFFIKRNYEIAKFLPYCFENNKEYISTDFIVYLYPKDVEKLVKFKAF